MRSRISSTVSLGLLLGQLSVAAVWAQSPCPATQTLGYSLNVTPINSSLPIKPVVISPAGIPNTGETFVANNFTIDVCLTCNGLPLVGLPATSVIVKSPDLCICPNNPNANAASLPTLGNGCTQFQGTIVGGGCTNSLDVYAGGTFLGSVPVQIISFDAPPASPCYSDASDLSQFAHHFGTSQPYSICFDFNKDGYVDASDLSRAAILLGADCH